ncbi:MAG: hypothetical protein PVF95_06335 [bacterium]
MKSRVGVILVTLFAVTVIAVAMGHADRGDGRGQGQGRGHGGFFGQMTEEQRGALHEKVEEMREAGADREEIREAVNAMLESWGIEVPERPSREGREGRRGEHMHHPPFFDQLTGEQKAELRGLIDGMREAGASREDVHAAVREKLEGWGIEVPERPGPGDCRGHRSQIFKQLTEEQRKEIHATFRQMREAEATREEIRAAIREKLESYGVELPDGDEGVKTLDALEEGNRESATWGKIKSKYH